MQNIILFCKKKQVMICYNLLAIPYPLRGLGERTVRFTQVIDAAQMPAAVLEYCKQ